MKNRFIVVYTVFASIIFIFSISFFGFNLYREFTTNLEKSDKKVFELSRLRIAFLKGDAEDPSEEAWTELKDQPGSLAW